MTGADLTAIVDRAVFECAKRHLPEFWRPAEKGVKRERSLQTYCAVPTDLDFDRALEFFTKMLI